nr:spidroin-1-like [Aegilops tauschii subsp. strangulata]
MAATHPAYNIMKMLRSKGVLTIKGDTKEAMTALKLALKTAATVQPADEGPSEPKGAIPTKKNQLFTQGKEETKQVPVSEVRPSGATFAIGAGLGPGMWGPPVIVGHSGLTGAVAGQSQARALGARLGEAIGAAADAHDVGQGRQRRLTGDAVRPQRQPEQRRGDGQRRGASREAGKGAGARPRRSRQARPWACRSAARHALGAAGRGSGGHGRCRAAASGRQGRQAVRAVAAAATLGDSSGGCSGAQQEQGVGGRSAVECGGEQRRTQPGSTLGMAGMGAQGATKHRGCRQRQRGGAPAAGADGGARRASVRARARAAMVRLRPRERGGSGDHIESVGYGAVVLVVGDGDDGVDVGMEEVRRGGLAMVASNEINN